MEQHLIVVAFKRVATLTELKTTWSLEDAQHAHDALDAVEDAEARARATYLQQVLLVEGNQPRAEPSDDGDFIDTA